MVDRGLEYECPNCENRIVLAHQTTAATIICPYCDRQMQADGHVGVQFVGHKHGIEGDENYRLADEDAPQHEERIPGQ
jgi:DNA-directed RNA polymerase subunit RPC12/RpoP